MARPAPHGGGVTKLHHLPQRLLVRHRRLVAALFAALSVLCLAAALRPAPEPGVPVVVAARDLPGGIVLTAADLAVVDVPARAAPASRLGDAAPVVGKVLAAAVDRGVAVTARSVVSEQLVAGTDGRVLAPVRFPDADLAVLLAPGIHVDVVAADDGTAEVVARKARVVALPQPSADGGMFGQAGGQRGLLVILEVTPTEASALAQAAARGRLGLTLR